MSLLSAFMCSYPSDHPSYAVAHVKGHVEVSMFQGDAIASLSVWQNPKRHEKHLTHKALGITTSFLLRRHRKRVLLQETTFSIVRVNLH